MAPPRRKNLVSSRRRVKDDGEEEEGSVVAVLDDDSSTEGSAISDADDDADAEGSEVSDAGTPRKSPMKRRVVADKEREETNGRLDEPVVTAKKTTFTAAMGDTAAMMNGLNIAGNPDEMEAINFDEMGQEPQVQPTQVDPNLDPSGSVHRESLIERRRREHEEYKKKRDADPAFVPNRGGFFMHDHRSAASGPNGFKPLIRGRGRARGSIGTSYSPTGQAQSTPNPADAPWAHDLHESVSLPEAPVMSNAASKSVPVSGQPAKVPYPTLKTPPNRSFSRTTHVGNVHIRVFISGMKEPVVLSAVPVNQHTRLPHHRPPLRRDKPVRISLPSFSPRYIYPAIDRSFIFIPRALRPNQQGFGRGRGRGSWGGYGGYASRRTSTYGGSNYSPSVAMSRRSSLAREVQRDGIASPAGSTRSHNPHAALEMGNPVVRLPPTSDHGHVYLQQSPYTGSPAPVVNLPLHQSYALPPKPLPRENRPEPLTMHQPRPQKTVSVADIESPATLHFHPPQQQQQQPFHQQVPLPANGHAYPPDPTLYPHSRHPSHPSQGGTPLSQIPERAVHAPPFQPYPSYPPAPVFYPQPYPAPMYYYPPPPPNLAPAVTAPVFVPGQPYPYEGGAAPPLPPSESTAPSTVAHESNGMVYYYDSSQMTTGPDHPPAFPPVAYMAPHGYMIPPPPAYYPTP